MSKMYVTDTDTGKLVPLGGPGGSIPASGSSGGGGGDASASNQATEIARLDSILAKLPATPATETSVAAVATATGAPTDAAWNGSGSGGIVAILKSLRSLLAGTLSVFRSLGVATILLNAVTATGAGTSVQRSGYATYHATGATTSGIGAATIVIEVSNDGSNWLTKETINLTLSTTPASAGYEMDAPWTYVRGNVTSISGTGASVSLYMGV
jgi:hypothetical protein